MITITIPIYNEQENIETLYSRLTVVLQEINKPWELILVNDGSTDNSKAILDNIAKQDNNVKVVHFRRNFGQTAALMAGLDFAEGDIIIPMDGDLQNDPKDIPRLIEKLDEGFDVVSGWRKNRKDNSVKRILPSRVANALISAISGVYLHDYGCSLKAYRKDVVKGVKLYGEMHRFVPIYATWQGAKVTEIIVTHHPRIHGKSKYGFERVIKVILDLIVVKFLHRYASKPMYVFGGFGFLNFLIGFITGSYALYLKFVEKISFVQTPLPLLTVFTILVGILCILLGLLAELLIRTYHESQNKSVYLIKETKNI